MVSDSVPGVQSEARRHFRVLIVEDEEKWEASLRTGIEMALGEASSETVLAREYRQAKDYLENQDFDLIVLDYRLSEIEPSLRKGLPEEGELLVAQIPIRNRATPVIVTSAYATPKKVRDGLVKGGISDFFDKAEFDLYEFAESIRRCLGYGPAEESASGGGVHNLATLIDQLSGTVNILVIFANPTGSDPLRLQEENRIINECIKLCKYRDRLSLTTCPAARIDDVRRALLEQDYQIVQFSGHATKMGLAFEGEGGELEVIPQDALAKFMSRHSPPVACVILNACYTVSQGELVSMGVPFTIAMDGPVSDDAAKEFTRGFYDAIGAGKDLRFAYEEGCSTIALKGYTSEELIPKLLERESEKV